MGQITRVSYEEFISKTRESLARYEGGNADENDVAQLGYAAENGVDHVLEKRGYGIRTQPSRHDRLYSNYRF